MKKLRKPIHSAALLLAITTLAAAAQLSTQRAANEPKSWADSQTLLDQCTFSNGAQLSFGHAASASNASDGDVWLAGKYHAASFRVSERLALPPLDHPTDIPAGRYTIFVDATKADPILIISKKTGERGMAYPGEQYDVARTELASDATPRPSVETFAIGCVQYDGSPIFLWIRWGRHLSYAQLVAVETQAGKAQYLLR